MQEKTGYSLSRAWFDWAFENPDKARTIHTALYMWFLEKWNRVGQKEKFSVTTSESMEVLGISSRNTYAKAFAELIDFGFIILVKKSFNQNSVNIISLAQKLSKQEDSSRTALDKAIVQAQDKQEDSSRTINKQVNNETTKPVTNKQFVKPTIEELNLYFSQTNFTGIVQEEAQAFFDYYTSNGWKVGKNGMKDWKAAVRNWIKNYNKFSNGSKSRVTAHQQNLNDLADLSARAREAKAALAGQI